MTTPSRNGFLNRIQFLTVERFGCAPGEVFDLNIGLGVGDWFSGFDLEIAIVVLIGLFIQVTLPKSTLYVSLVVLKTKSGSAVSDGMFEMRLVTRLVSFQDFRLSVLEPPTLLEADHRPCTLQLTASSSRQTERSFVATLP